MRAYNDKNGLYHFEKKKDLSQILVVLQVGITLKLFGSKVYRYICTKQYTVVLYRI